MANQIVANVEHIASGFPEPCPGAPDENDFTLATERIQTETHPIYIIGNRGTGKSTLLVEVLNRLRETQRYVILPPLSPELFGGRDSLLNVALAATHQLVQKVGPSAGDKEHLDVVRRLQTARRSAAMNAIPLDQLMHAASSIHEVARELQDMAGGTEQLWQDVQRLFTSLVSLQQSTVAAIIPVDDADMMKASVQLDLLREIRLLGGCRHVIPIVALNEDEVTRRVTREMREDFYPRLGLKADFDPNVERVVHDAVAPQLRKTLPQWARFPVPQPTWLERVQYAPLNSEQDLAALLQRAEPPADGPVGASSAVSHLLLAPTPAVERLVNDGIVTHPLPANLRKLAQLWTSLQLGMDGPSDQSPPEELAHILNSLQDSIDTPFGIEFPPEADFRATDSGGEGPCLIANVDYRGLYGTVQRGDWLEVTAKSRQLTQSDSDVYYDLGHITKLVPRWRVSASTVPDYIDALGAHSLALAIQGILLDSHNAHLGPTSRLAYGTSLDALRFLQVVSFSGIRTDDTFIVFPQTSDLVSTARVVSAWSQIVERARRDHLKLPELLTLSLWSSIAIFMDNSDPDVENSPTDYRTAFAAASNRAESVRLAHAAGESVRVSARHFLAWYQYWVPGHWHEALFDPNEIQDFIDHTLNASGGDTAVEAPARVYHDTSLSSRLRRYCKEAGTTESVETHAWIGGYHQVIEGLHINLPPTWDTLVIPAWRRATNARRVGGAAVAHSTSHELGQSDDMELATEGDAELLTAYTTARLGSWGRP